MKRYIRASKRYSIRNDALAGESEKSIRVFIGEHGHFPDRGTVWLPKSQIHFKQDSTYTDIEVPQWLLDRNGLGILDDIICG